MFIIEILASFLAIVLPVLISVAYLTLAERKIMGGMQQRMGPNVVGFHGLLQPFLGNKPDAQLELRVRSVSSTIWFDCARTQRICVLPPH